MTQITGLSYRQLDHWSRLNLVTPLFNRGQRSHGGRFRVFSYDDLLQLWAMKLLLDSGLRLAYIGDHLPELRDMLTDTDVDRSEWVIGESGVAHLHLNPSLLRRLLADRIEAVRAA